LLYLCIMRLVAFIWAFFYFMSAVGYGAEVHYCLGQVSDVSYIWFDASCVCDETGEQLERPMGCCEDERFFVQLEDDHQNSASTAIAQVQLKEEKGFRAAEASATERLCPVYVADRAPPSTKERLIALHRLTFYA
jgi:hypothetical protein